MAGVSVVLIAVLFLLLPGRGHAQEANCRQALALGLDVSGSVDVQEYRLQMQGLAFALGVPAVRNALLSTPQSPVEILVFEWSGVRDQHVILPWQAIRTPADISGVQQLLTASVRRKSSRGTAIGEALEFARMQLAERKSCWNRTLDISGDGKANLGLEPKTVRDAMAAEGITINALVIGADAPSIADQRQAEIGELSSYYRTNVIAGDDAFVQTALGYEEYAQAMARKLERELKTLVFSGNTGVSGDGARLR